ncbi:MAG: hypothetical protein V1881_02495, partial [Candidatus Micrarchaeota archaeon]
GATERGTISFPYVKADGKVAFDGGTPNCFTANKYGEKTKGVLQGCALTGASADALRNCLSDETNWLRHSSTAACSVTGTITALSADNCLCDKMPLAPAP